jgi:hypothetical protein
MYEMKKNWSECGETRRVRKRVRLSCLIAYKLKEQ